MSIPNITRTNTIDEWRIQTNQSAGALNTLETGNYTKSNGSLSLTGNSSLIITANGTALQVSNSALFQSNVTVAGDMGIGVQETSTGNVTMGGILVVRGPGTGLQVSNNALVNGNMQVTRTITTNNITANSNVTIGGNESVGGILRLTGSSDVLYVNTGVAKINTATITDLTSTNTDITTATIGEESVTISTIQIGTIIQANAYNLTSTTANIGVANIITGSIVTANIDILNANSATIQANTSVGGRLTVTGNTQSGNLVTTGLTQTGSLRATGRADIGGILTAGATTLSSAVVTNNLEVQGNFTIAGQTSFDSNIIVLRSTTPQTNGSGYSYFGVNRGNTTSVSGTANANAYIRWNEPSYMWEVRDVLNTNDSTAYSKILTANLISDSLTSTSSGTLASSNTISILTNQQASTGRYANSAYLHANASYISQNTTGSYANSAYRHANSSHIQANSAFDMANLAFQSGGVTAGSFANSAYAQANIATTNAATADQKAVSAGSYANSAYSLANTKFASAGGTVSGDVTVTGNLTVSGTTTYANTTTVNLGDNIITLNADLGQSTTPSENAGIEIERGVKPNAQFIWVESSEKWSANNGNSSFFIGSEAASSYANSAYGQANTGTILAQAAFNSANNVGPQVAPAFTQANSAYNQANTATTNAATADQKAVSAGSYANSGYTQANTGTTLAQAAFNTANGKIASVTITNGTGISGGGTGSSFTLSIGQAVATSSDVQFNSIGVGTGATGTSGEIRATNNITAYYSDDRLKTKLGNIDNALDKLMTLTGFYYEANETAQKLGYLPIKEVGVSAQEVQNVMPEVVAPAPIDEQYLTVRYERLVPLIIEAIKELKKEIDQIKLPK